MRLLRLNRPIDQAKMKCRHCGAVFIGSTAESPHHGPSPAEVFGPALSAPPDPFEAFGAAPAAAAKPAAPAKPGAAQEPPVYKRRKKSYAPVIITAVLLAGLIPLIILAAYYNSRPSHTIKDSTGKVLYTGRDQAKYAEWKKIAETGYYPAEGNQPAQLAPRPAGGGD
jgi:hypothetical protein